MSFHQILFDETEATTTRYIGFFGETTRFDLMITTTEHFYGKKVVTNLQTGRTAILNEKDAANAPYLLETFQLHNEAEANELSEFLLSIL
jgi:hypothetical protein